MVCGCGLTCSRASTKTPPNGFLNHKRYTRLYLKHTGHSNIQFRPPRHAGHSGIWRVGAEQARGVLTGQRAAHLLSCLPEVLWTCAQGNPLRSGPPAAAQRASEHDLLRLRNSQIAAGQTTVGDSTATPAQLQNGGPNAGLMLLTNLRD